MASLVKNVEREFLLTAAMREKAELIMTTGNAEWTVRIAAVDKGLLRLSHEAPLALLQKGKALDFRYNVRGQTIAFKSRVVEPGERVLAVSMPDALYKNLSRRFARLPPPGDLAVSFSFAGERYDLDFPQSQGYAAASDDYLSPGFDPADLRELMAQFERKAALSAGERGVVMYKGRKPEGPVELLASSTGRIFFMPSAIAGVPMTDPFSERTILTKEDFCAYFMEGGLDREFALDEVARIERSRRTQGVLAEILVPILFQDYAIGHVSLVNRQQGMPPFDLRTVETYWAFARSLAWSLKLHGYFKGAPTLTEEYATEVLDVSAGGILFACRDEKLIRALKEGLRVSVSMTAKRRKVEASGVVRSHYADRREGCFGIELDAMAPEDFRFLFEYLYGRPFTDEDGRSIEGIRILRP